MFRSLRIVIISLLVAGAAPAAPGRIRVERNPELLGALAQQRAAIREQLIRRGYRPNAAEGAELAVPRELQQGLVFPIAKRIPVMAQKGATPLFSPNSHEFGLRYALDTIPRTARHALLRHCPWRPDDRGSACPLGYGPLVRGALRT